MGLVATSTSLAGTRCRRLFASKDADSKATSALYLGGLKHTYMINDRHYVRTTLAYSKSQNTFTEDKYRDTTYSSSFRNTDVNDDIHRLTLHSYITSKFSAKISSKLGLTLDNRQLISTVDDRGLGFDFDRDGQADLLRIRNINGNVTTVEPYANLKIKSSDHLTYVVGLHGQLHTQTSNFALEPRLGINYTVSTTSAFNLGYGLHSQLQPLPVFFLLIPDDQQNFVASNQNLDFTRSHHFVLGYEYKPNKDWRIKTETYYQSLYNVPVERAASSFSLLNAGADFVFPQISHLVNEGTGRNYGVELTVEKFFSQSYYALFTTSLFQSKYKSSDDIERNTTFNNEYVINALCGKEWKINPKWMLTTDMKFTAAGGRYVTPSTWQLHRSRAKKYCNKTSPLPKNSAPTSGWTLRLG
ncbi:MAG: TonB-dependent receptor [Saprospiraceae bacterium]|nr:TonB-dependent receptor [Saprospiraceae bacterium]